MHRHARHERTARDVARAALRQQRASQDRRGDLDDMKTVGLERDTDDLERARPTRLGNRECAGRGGSQQRDRARCVDPRRLVGPADLLLVARAILGIAELAQPCRDFGVGRRRNLAARKRPQPERRDIGLDGAQRHRQHPALGRLDDAERARELDQRRQVAGLRGERETRRVGQRAAGVVGQPGRHLDTVARTLVEGAAEGHAIDGLRVGVEFLRRDRTARPDQPHLRRQRARHLARKADAHRLER